MVENQIAELREVAMRNGSHVALELTDSGISGSKGRDQRPALNDLIYRATRPAFDIEWFERGRDLKLHRV
jgi:hypothetical protein